MMIHALQARKHVYVEKPLGNSIGECHALVKVQNKYQKVVQVGQWQRSQSHFKNALNFMDSELLGNIRTVKVWCYQGWMRPDPTKDFNSSRFHFRWF